MFTRIAIAFALMVGAVNAQTLIAVTNVRSTVQAGPAYTLTGAAGQFRIMYTVETTPGIALDVNDGSTFRQYVYDSIGHLVQSNANSTTPESSLSVGQVKFLMASLPAGIYRVRGVATPVSGDTNAAWNITHHWLTVTNSASIATASVSIPSFGYTEGTNTPGHVRIYSGGDLATGAVDGANLSLYLPDDSGGGVTQTGQVDSVTVTGATIRAAVTIAGDGVTMTGQTINIAGASAQAVGTVQLYTNEWNVVGYTNRSGFWEPVHGMIPATNASTVLHRYDSPTEITSNLNIGAVTVLVTNGIVTATLPNESSSLHGIDYIPVTSGHWSRVSVHIKQHPQHPIASAAGITVSGLAWRRHDNTNYLFGTILSSTTEPLMRFVEYTPAFSVVGYPALVAPYNPATTVPFNNHTPLNDTWFYLDHDGTNVWRGYYSAHWTTHPNMFAVYTNAGSIAGYYIGLHSFNATTGGTNTYMLWDNFSMKEGELWENPRP